MQLQHYPKHTSRMKKLLLLLSVLLCLPLAAQQRRPKVAVVLSGGNIDPVLLSQLIADAAAATGAAS